MIFLKVVLFAITINNSPKIVDYGRASVYRDKSFACPVDTYRNNKLPTCASRTLPCGMVINVKNIENDKIAQCRIIDRGPFGACIPSKKTTRACGIGAKWFNAAKYIRKKMPIISINWRGIVDMSPRLAHLLGVKDRLIHVMIYTPSANNQPSTIIQDDIYSIKDIKKHNDFSNIAKMDGMYGTTTSIDKSRDQEVAQDFRY